jgi:hypothetical protein
MASSEIKEALKTAADAVAMYVQDAAVLTVETQTVEVGKADKPMMAGKTTIKLDGDSTSVLPTVKSEAGKLEIDPVLYDLHMQNVQAAIDYRAQVLNALLEILRP